MAKTARVARITKQPDDPPPSLVCPDCDEPLQYEQTIFGGVNPPERWDRFRCRADGVFEYRHRTRRIRHAT
jgi:hypothetical protein